MTDKQIQSHEEYGENLHIPAKKGTAEHDICAICGALIMRSVVNPNLWLESSVKGE